MRKLFHTYHQPDQIVQRNWKIAIEVNGQRGCMGFVIMVIFSRQQYRVAFILINHVNNLWVMTLWVWYSFPVCSQVLVKTDVFAIFSRQQYDRVKYLLAMNKLAHTHNYDGVKYWKKIEANRKSRSFDLFFAPMKLIVVSLGLHRCFGFSLLLISEIEH